MGSNLAITSYEKIYSVIRKIPEGKVATYGQIAAIAGNCTPRMVGYALAALKPGSNVPWQRVVNSLGKISLRSDGIEDTRQRRLLETEKVFFDQNGRINLGKFKHTF